MLRAEAPIPMDSADVHDLLASLETTPRDGDVRAFRARLAMREKLSLLRERIARGPRASRAEGLAAVEARLVELDAADAATLADARARIRDGILRGAALDAELAWLSELDPRVSSRHLTTEPLDAFLAGMLDASRDLEGLSAGPSLVHYEPAPGSVVRELAARLPLGPEDFVLDVGSGAGHLPIVLHLLTSVRAGGVELEPTVFAVGRAAVTRLGLAHDVVLEHVDAREADYRQGTVFFLFTPFVGQVLEDVLDRIAAQRRAPYRVVTFGPCTRQVTSRHELRLLDGDPDDEFRLAVFSAGPSARPPT